MRKKGVCMNNDKDREEETMVEGDSTSRIKEMQEREYRQRQKREHDIQVERSLYEQTY